MQYFLHYISAWLGHRKLPYFSKIGVCNTAVTRGESKGGALEKMGKMMSMAVAQLGSHWCWIRLP